MARFATMIMVGSAVGCASISVTSRVLEDRTAFTLGLAKDQFTIADRRDGGIRTDYSVRTAKGERFNCYVTGSVGVVSDAICTKVAVSGAVRGRAEKKSAGEDGSSCNALLRAAGRC